MVTLDLEGRVRAIKSNFFKKFIRDGNFFYQIEQCEKLQLKCLKENRYDLAEELAIINLEGLEWFNKIKRDEKDDNESVEELII